MKKVYKFSEYQWDHLQGVHENILRRDKLIGQDV